MELLSLGLIQNPRYFVCLLSQIHRRLYSIGRGSVVEWVLSVPSKVRLLGSFLRYRLGSFYQQQKTVKPGPSTGTLCGGFLLKVAHFLDSHVFSFIKKCFSSGVSKVIFPQLFEQRWVQVRSLSINQGRQSCWPSRGIRFPSRQSGEVFFPSDRCDEILRLSSLRL